MALDISGLNFFMPVFTFFLAFFILYAVLVKTKILGENSYILLFVSFILTAIFMSVSSLKEYVGVIVPWTVVLVVIAFLLLVLAGISFKKLDDVMTKRFSWAFIVVMVVVFAVAALYVFNPYLNKNYILSSGNGEQVGIVGQLVNFFGNSTTGGSLLLIVIAIVVGWIITRQVKK